MENSDKKNHTIQHLSFTSAMMTNNSSLEKKRDLFRDKTKQKFIDCKWIKNIKSIHK